MGRASTTARLLSLYALWARSSAANGGVHRNEHPARGRLFSAALQKIDERASVLPRPVDDCGRCLLCAPCLGPAAAGAAGPATKLYTGIYMLRSKILLIALAAGVASAEAFSGASAFEYTKRAVEMGPRPSGSPANLKLQAFIEAELKKRGAEVTEDAFTAT